MSAMRRRASVSSRVAWFGMAAAYGYWAVKAHGWSSQIIVAGFALVLIAIVLVVDHLQR